MFNPASPHIKQDSPRRLRAVAWIKLITITGFSQIIIQLTALISGVLIIRLLPTKEYALYTLANAMLGTMTVLADGGISTAVMAQGGKVWQDREKLGVVMSSGLELRKKFGIVSLLISMPVLFYLLVHHGAGYFTAILIIAAMVPAFFAALSDSLLETASKLHQDIKKLQKNQLATGIGRFVLIVGSLIIFPWTFVAILGNGIPRMWANLQLRKMSNVYADPLQKSNNEVKKEIISVVKRTLPGAIYFCVSGQIAIWLISIFGSTASIAHIGALSRLTTVLSLFTVIFNTLMVPRFARLAENAKLLLARFVQIQIALFAICILIVLSVTIFPSQILQILGKGYLNLNTEMLLITISSCLAMLAGVTYSVVVSRGWILKPVINISINILFQLVLIFTLDLSKTRNVLIFSIVDFLVGYIIILVYFLYRVFKLKSTYL